MAGPSPPRPRPSLVGAIALIVIGLLVFIPSGLCTGVVIFAPIIAAMPDPRSAAAIGATAIVTGLFVGGPFVFGGGALLWFGVKNLRAHFRKPDEG